MNKNMRTMIYKSDGWWFVKLVDKHNNNSILGPFMNRTTARAINKDLKKVCYTADSMVDMGLRIILKKG